MEDEGAVLDGGGRFSTVFTASAILLVCIMEILQARLFVERLLC